MSASFGFAQVVTVPAGCIVVQTNTAQGGVLGAGGVVTTGGVVTMPDGYLGGTFSCTTPSGTTLNSWFLQGDLSVTTTNVPPAVAVQPSGALSAYSIQSYNKNLRPFEGITGSAASKLAKSKGKVSINYTSGVCSGLNFTFDVYKTYTVVPPAIVGPTCITANTACTFSIDLVASDNTPENIGFDQYYWSGFPSSSQILPNSLYYSADGSSITFTPTTSNPFTIKCCLGRANPWDGGLGSAQNNPTTATACVTKTVGVAPQPPTFLTNTGGLIQGLATCVNTGVSSISLSYNYPPAGTTYTWSTPNNWIIGSSNSATETKIFTLDNNSGEIRLKVTSSCGSVDYVYKIGRRFTTAIAITGPTCISAGTNNVFSVDANATINTAQWTVSPAPSAGVFSTSTNSLTTTHNLNPSALVPPGQYTLTATSNPLIYNGYTCQGAITKIINVLPPAPILLATSPTCVLKGTTPITTIQVDTSVAGTPTTGYSWNISGAPGWTISAGATTSTPTFVPSGTTNGPVTITVVRAGTNGCDSAPVLRTIKYIAVQTLPDTIGSFCDQYTLSCGTLNSWVVNGVIINPLSLPTNITIANNILSICGNGGTPIGTVCAIVVGVPTQICATSLGSHTLRPSSSVNNGGVKLLGISIFPNPSKGEFSIKVDDLKQAAGASVTDSSGKLLGTFELIKGENKISIPNLIQGVYSVNLIKDGKQELRQIIIE